MKNGTKRTSDLSVLYVESDATLQKEISAHLKKIFSKVYQAFDGLEGLNQCKKNKPDIVLTDLNLSDKNGFEMIVDMQDLDSKISIIVLSDKNGDFELLETLDLGIIALLQKPLHLSNLNRALQKVILLKPNKIVPQKVTTPKPVLKPKPITKPMVLKPIQTKKIVQKPVRIEPVVTKIIEKKPVKKVPIKKEEIKIIPPKEVPAIVKPIKKKPLPKDPLIELAEKCNKIITSAIEYKLDITCINNYKGLLISNNGKIVKFQNKLLTVQVTKTQLFSVIHEKKIVLCIKNQYILAMLSRVDKKNNQIILKNPQIIQYTQRDNKNKRIAVDKSFKTTIGYDNVQTELSPYDISYNYITLETKEQLDLQENTSLELTIGFEINAPSSLVHEKKFTKVFATGIIKRIQNDGNTQKIIIEHKIQRSGQNVFKKYLQEREINIIKEFKMKIKS